MQKPLQDVVSQALPLMTRVNSHVSNMKIPSTIADNATHSNGRVVLFKSNITAIPASFGDRPGLRRCFGREASDQAEIEIVWYGGVPIMNAISRW